MPEDSDEILAEAVRPSVGVAPAPARPLTAEQVRATLERRIETYAPPPAVHPRDYLRALVGLGRDPSMGETITYGDYETGLVAWSALRGDALVVAERAVDLAWADHLRGLHGRG